MNAPHPLLYPIRAVSKLTGISIDTLRAWERRYQAVSPQRDDRGRLYTEAHVQRLRWLHEAVAKGHAIGRLAPLNDGELQELLAQPMAQANESLLAAPAHLEKTARELQTIIAAITSMDYAGAEQELASLAALLTPRELVYRVALPLMKHVGEAWHAGTLSIAQEHMTTSLLRNLLGALLPLYRRTAPTAKLLFATPSGEHHEIGLLLAAMLTVGGGLGIIYLGPNLPAGEIVTAAQKTAPQAVILAFIGANGAGAATKELQEVAHKLPAQIELWIGGPQNPEIVSEVKKTRALLIEDFARLEQHLIRLGARF